MIEGAITGIDSPSITLRAIFGLFCHSFTSNQHNKLLNPQIIGALQPPSGGRIPAR